MPTLNMDGPFELTQEVIDSIIPEGYPGNYAYGHIEDNSFIVEYVGRSDNDLKVRIRHGIGQYPMFKFSIASSPIGAYHKECRNWHEFGGEENYLDNKIHPAAPKDMTYAFCPICTRRILDKIRKIK